MATVAVAAWTALVAAAALFAIHDDRPLRWGRIALGTAALYALGVHLTWWPWDAARHLLTPVIGD